MTSNGGFSWANSGNQIILPVDDIDVAISGLDHNKDDRESE